MCPERYADSRVQNYPTSDKGEEKGSIPLPIWTAAIPTPPAAANTSNHSPVWQEVLRILDQLLV